MAYAGIDKKRLAQLLELGADDEELRRFFFDSRLQLIQRGARVQNLPHGKTARIRVLTQGLPTATDRVVQRWFSENLTMLDPDPVADVINSLRMYEEAGESPPEQEAKRLARSCLVHLFAADPASDLLSFLRPTKVGAQAEQSEVREPSSTVDDAAGADSLPTALVTALIALEQGQDPDEQLSSLPPAAASLVAGIYAARVGNEREVSAALEALDEHPEARSLLSAHAAKSASARARPSEGLHGLQVVPIVEADDSTTFDCDRDEVIAVCTRDVSETAVFLRPFAMRSAGGGWVSLARSELRGEMFWTSGDLIAFPGGREYPRQPRRWEVGIWRVAENSFSRPTNRTNFHIASDKTPVFEVCAVPFTSTDYDGAREYIKHYVDVSGPETVRMTLFLLRDDLIVGSPQGKDLSRDEGFESGLPSWRALPALRFEGRLLVPGPLPVPEIYECESLASSLRKLLANDNTSTADRLTKAQLKRIQEMITSGASRLNAARAERLRAELRVIDEHEGAMTVLLDAVMEQPKIAEQISRLVQEQVDALVGQKDELRRNIEELKRQQAAANAERKRTENEQRAMAPAVAKAIRGAFDKARREAVETLGQVAVYKALVDGAIERPSTPLVGHPSGTVRFDSPLGVAAVRQARGSASSSAVEVLRSLGVTPKCAEALQVVGQVARTCGLILIVDGVAARLAAEGWLVAVEGTRKVLECQIGLTDDRSVLGLLADAPAGVAILDANLSPLDAYARPLIDAVQRRIAGVGEQAFDALVVLSLTSGVAALPVPPSVESISLRVALDRRTQFLPEADAVQRLEEIAVSDEPVEWIARLWKPAAGRVLNHLQSISPNDAALVLSVLDGAQGNR